MYKRATLVSLLLITVFTAGVAKTTVSVTALTLNYSAFSWAWAVREIKRKVIIVKIVFMT